MAPIGEKNGELIYRDRNAVACFQEWNSSTIFTSSGVVGTMPTTVTLVVTILYKLLLEWYVGR